MIWPLLSRMIVMVVLNIGARAPAPSPFALGLRPACVFTSLCICTSLLARQAPSRLSMHEARCRQRHDTQYTVRTVFASYLPPFH